jgi:hypothetical protein
MAAAGAGSLGGGTTPASLPASGDADTSSTTPPTDSSGADGEDGAADAPSSGVAQEAPAASSTPELDGPGADNAPAANDNKPIEELPASGTE